MKPGSHHSNTITPPSIETNPGTAYAQEMQAFDQSFADTTPGTLPMGEFEQSYNGPDAITPNSEKISDQDKESLSLNNRLIRELGDQLTAGEAVDNNKLLEVKRLLDANAERDDEGIVRLGPDGMPWRFRGQVDESTGKPSPLSQRSARAVYSAAQSLEDQLKAAEEAGEQAKISAEAISQAAVASEEQDKSQSRSATLEEARTINSGTKTVDQLLTERHNNAQPENTADSSKAADLEKEKSESRKSSTGAKKSVIETLRPEEKQTVNAIVEGLTKDTSNPLQKAELNKAIENLNPAEKEALVEQIANEALSTELASINLESIDPQDMAATTRTLDEFLFAHTDTSFTMHQAINDVYIQAFSKVLNSLTPEVKSIYISNSEHPFFNGERGAYPEVPPTAQWTGNVVMTETVDYSHTNVE